MIKIANPIIDISNDTATYKCKVSNKITSSCFEVQVGLEYKDFLTRKTDPVLVAMLLPAMANGEDIIIEGYVSPRLLHSANNALQEVLIANKPYLKRIDISANNTYIDRMNENHTHYVATGFSGGIDSFCTLYEYLIKPIPEDLQLTHLIHNSFTAFRKHHIQKERKIVKEVAQHLNIPLIEVNANIETFSFSPWSSKTYFESEAHTLWNASAALTLQAKIGTFYYSSAYRYKNINFTPQIDIAHTDPVLLNLLTSDSQSLISVGSEYTRVQKTELVTKFPLSYKYLNVCVNSNQDKQKNCSKCFKCKRTLFTLDLLKKLHLYKDVFYLDIWNKEKSNYIKEIALCMPNDYFSWEIREFSEKIGFKFPLEYRIKSYFLMKKDVLKTCIKRLLHKDSNLF